MAIVNTLEVQVKATTASFNRGMKKASGAVKKFSKSNQNLGDVLKNAKNSLLAINPAVLAVGVAAIGATTAIVRLTTKTAQYAESLQKMSLRLGLGVEAIEELRFAAEQSGASLESLTPAFRALARAAFEASLGTEEYLKVFRELGVEVTDENGKLKELDMLLEDVADGLLKTEGSTKKLALAQMVLGRGATALLPLFENGAQGIRDLREERRELGVGISVEFARESAEFVDNLNRVRTVLRAGGITIAEEFLPSLNLMLDAMVLFGKDVGPKFVEQFEKVTGLFDGLGDSKVLSGIAKGTLAISDAFNRLTEGFKGPLPFGFAQISFITKQFSAGAHAGQALRDAAKAAAEGIDEVDEALEPANEKLEIFSATLTDIFAKMQGTLAQNLEATIKAIMAPLEAMIRATEDLPQILPDRADVQEFAEGTVTAFDLLQGRAQVFFDSIADGARTSFEIAARFAEGFGDALVDSATEGTAAFADFFKGLLKGLARAIVRALILRTILGIFGLGSGGFLKDVGKLLVGSGGGQMIPPTRMSAILASPGAAGDPGTLAGQGGNISPGILKPQVNIQVLEPSPLTEVLFVDNVVAPRMRQRSDELNEEPL